MHPDQTTPRGHEDDATMDLLKALDPWNHSKSEDDRLEAVQKAVGKGADITVQDYRTKVHDKRIKSGSPSNNTPLHITVLKKYRKVFAFLIKKLKEGPGIETALEKINNKGETVLKLIRDPKYQNILQDIDLDKEIIEKINQMLSAPQQKSTQAKRGERADKYEDLVFCLVERTGRTKFPNSDFSIGREIKTRETNDQKFDDTFFSYKQNGKKYLIPTQVKHKGEGEVKKIKSADLENLSGEFSISKYFLSYLDLRNDIDKITNESPSHAENENKQFFKDGEIQHVVIFTSASTDTEQLRQANFELKDAPKGVIDIFDLSLGTQEPNYKQLEKISSELNAKLLTKLSEFEQKNDQQQSLTETQRQEEIKNFLNRLVFIINQPKVEDLEWRLSDLTRRDIFKDTPFETILGDATFEQYKKNLEKDLSKKGGRPSGWIDGEKATNYFQEQAHQVQTSLIVAGLTVMYNKKILGYGAFENLNTLTKLNKFLDGDSGGVLCIQTSKTLLSSIKLLQYLNTKEQYILENCGRISVTLEEILQSNQHREAIVEAFKLSSANLLMIECKDEVYNQESITHLYQALSSIIQENSNKKIILVTQKDKPNVLAEYFKPLDLPKYHPIDDTINLKEFKPNEDPLEKKLILLQGEGEKISLNQLTHPFPVDSIDVNTFADLVQGKEINIGSKLTDLGKVKDYYIDRKFYQIEIKTNIEKDREFPDKLVYTKEHFNQLCKESPDSNIHWLKSQSDNLIWQKSQGSVSALRKYMQSGESRINYYSESDLLDHSVGHKVVVIADTAGMGKSTVLTSLSQAMKDKSSYRWVIRINLIKYTDQLAELKSSQFNKDQAIDFLLNKLLKVNDGLEKKLLENNLVFGSNNGMQVVILLDGFDEITPDYKDIVINLLGELKKTKVERLLVTTRPNMRTDLESKLDVLSYDLKPFSKDKDQIDFLVKFWKQKFNQEKISQVDDQKLKIYGNDLITLLSGSTNGEETEFTGIPLHISMVAEVFYENKEGKQEKAWEGCKEFLDAANIPNQKPTLPNQFNIAELYERFVKTKFYDIHFKEKREIDFTKPGIKRTFDRDYKKFIKQQQELALYTLLNNEDFTKLSSTNQEEINGWIQDIKSGDENQGIIDQIIDDKPHFTHATFAEYFASFPLAEKMVGDFSGTLEHVNKILPNTSPILINSIIKQLEDTKRTEVLALLEDKPLINFAAQNGYLNLVKTLLESNHDTWPQSDYLGKTPLHYAAEYGHSTIVKYLLSHHNDILEENILEHGIFKKEEYRESKLVRFVNEKDTNDRTALYYAAKNNKMEIACDLLLKGADSSELDEYTRPLVSYVIGQVHCAYAGDDHKLRPIEEKLLLQDPSAASTLDSFYELPRLLSYFFRNGRVEVIKAILNTIENQEKRRNVLNQDDNGYTPLDRVNLSEELSDDNRLKVTKYLEDNGGIETSLVVGFECEEEERSSHYTKILQAAARDGHIKTFQYFINQENRDCYYLHLYQATRNNQIDIIHYLFDNHREDVKHNGNTALHTAVDSGSVLKNIKYFIDSGEDVNAKNDRGKSPLILEICARSRLNIIRYLIARGADVNMQDNELKTPLDYAIENEGRGTSSSDQVDFIKYLLVKCNANIPESVRNQAEFFKNPHEFNLNLIDENGMPRLHRAIQSNDIQWSKFIIRKGGDINLKDKDGKTPLHWASQLQKIEIVELLLQYGAMYNVVDLNGKIPLDLLSNSDSFNESGTKIGWLLNTLDQLFESESLTQVLNDKLLPDTAGGRQKNFGPYGTQHADAVASRNPTLFILNAQNNKNNALLHLATDKDDEQALIALLEANQAYLKEKRLGSTHCRDYQFRSINGVNKDGNMPVHIAAIKGNTKMVRLLLNSGAIFNAKNNAGHTPEELSNDHNETYEFLQSVNAFFNAVDEDNTEILLNFILFYFIKEKLTLTNIRDENGKTALHHAASSGKIDIIQLLLDNDADIDSLDANHYTPLHLAVENDRMEVVKLLLKQGANFNVKNKEGKSPFELIESQSSRLLGSINELFIGIEGDNPESVINYLKIVDVQKTYNINIGTIINVRDNQGNTILHYAAENGYLDIVRFLLQNGAVFNIKNKLKRTPKEFTPNKNIAGLLSSIDEIFKHTNRIHQTQVDMKIITNVRNDEGMTILHVAVKEGDNHTVVALLKAGANIDAEDIYDKKPLCYAQEEYTENILEANRELLQAVESNDVNKVERLIVQEAVVSPSILHLAVQHADNEIVKRLLKSVNGNAELADLIKIADKDGNTALHLALKHGRYKVAKTLLTYAKNINDSWMTFRELILTPNNSGNTPFEIAEDKGKVKKIAKKFFKQAQASQENPPNAEIIKILEASSSSSQSSRSEISLESVVCESSNLGLRPSGPSCSSST